MGHQPILHLSASGCRACTVCFAPLGFWSCRLLVRNRLLAPEPTWGRGAKCSLVRVEQGKTFCTPQDPPPSPPQFCTRSLGTVDCWSNPDALNGPPPRGVADGPRTLTPAQEIDRTAHWPNL